MNANVKPYSASPPWTLNIVHYPTEPQLWLLVNKISPHENQRGTNGPHKANEWRRKSKFSCQ